jgi:cytochrome P450
MQRRKEFDRPLETLEMLNLFGKKVSAVEGQEWQRQRGIASIPFDEQNNSLVRAESLRQGTDILAFWESQGSKVIRSTADDAKTFMLHVLSSAGFGKSYPFKGSNDDDVDPQPSKYRDPLSPILDHILLIMILGPRLLTMCWMPKAWSRIGQAVFDFKAYMTEILVEEKYHIEQGKPTTGNLVASLICASGQVSHGGGTKGHGLSGGGIYGNIFVLHSAGYDTTAITLASSLVFLDANPEVRDCTRRDLPCPPQP